jgi:aspartate/methionine/tyrosine aminotransferase
MTTTALAIESDSIPVYASKWISERAKADPSIANLAIGEPDFGPPEHLMGRLDSLLSYHSFRKAVKSYEISKGLLSLREAISEWYMRRYGLRVDPSTELLITHGGVEAIMLAILSSSDPGGHVLITDPTYMLYEQSLRTLGRIPYVLSRTADSEYLGLASNSKEVRQVTPQPSALIVNSPENPTGYVISANEWQALSAFAEAYDLYLIHDEVYDSMTFGRPHIPARSIAGLESRSILVNSFSKKFGVPGLRIGWMSAKSEIIERASRFHDYLNLGVNILNEHVAECLIRDPGTEQWLETETQRLSTRATRVMERLSLQDGYNWHRKPLGGMFAFPSIRGLYDRLPSSLKSEQASAGEVVAQYLFSERSVAVVPGNTYGAQGSDCIRLVLCSADHIFEQALDSLASR